MNVKRLVLTATVLLSACAPAATPVAAPTATAAAPTEEAAAPTATLEPVQLKVGILNFMSNSPFFIAQEDGYFTAQSLTVELISFGTSDRDMIPALLQGQLDVALSTVSAATLNGIAQGAHARYVADKGYINPESECITEAVVARPALLDAGTLDTPQGLAGLNVTFSPGNPFEYVTDLVLERAGLTRDDVEVLDMRDHATRVEAMHNGSLDVTSYSEPWITRGRAQGAADTWISFQDLIPGFSIGTVMYGPSMLERKAEVGIRFMAAYLNAIQQYNQGPTDRNVAVIAEYTQLTPDEIRAVCWPSYRSDGKIAAEPLMGFEAWALERGYIDSALSINQIWDPQFIEGARALLGQ